MGVFNYSVKIQPFCVYANLHTLSKRRNYQRFQHASVFKTRANSTKYLF